MRRVGVSKEGDKEVNAQAAQKKRFRRRDMVKGGGGGKMKRYMDKSIGHRGFGFNDNTRWDSSLTVIETLLGAWAS